AYARVERAIAGRGVLASLPDAGVPDGHAIAEIDRDRVRVNVPGEAPIDLRDGEATTITAGALAIVVEAVRRERSRAPIAAIFGGARVHVAIVAAIHAALLFCGKAALASTASDNDDDRADEM